MKQKNETQTVLIKNIPSDLFLAYKAIVKQNGFELQFMNTKLFEKMLQQIVKENKLP